MVDNQDSTFLFGTCAREGTTLTDDCPGTCHLYSSASNYVQQSPGEDMPWSACMPNKDAGKNSLLSTLR